MSVKAGIPETKLAVLAAYECAPAFSDRERAALRFATALVRDRAVPDTDWTQLRIQFSEAEIVELVFAIGYQTFAGQIPVFAHYFSNVADDYFSIRETTSTIPAGS